MTDLTDLATRSAAMVMPLSLNMPYYHLFMLYYAFKALVGIAFSLGFIFGPIIGAVFSSKMGANSYIVYAYPAYFAIFLNVLNIFFVLKFLKESLPVEKRVRYLF